jgi:hypothetical protein
LLFFISPIIQINLSLAEIKNPDAFQHQDLAFAEREGFEPPEPHGSTVFKTAAIDHSAISP